MCMCGCEDIMRERWKHQQSHGGLMQWIENNWYWMSYVLTFFTGWVVAAYVYH